MGGLWEGIGEDAESGSDMQKAGAVLRDVTNASLRDYGGFRCPRLCRNTGRGITPDVVGPEGGLPRDVSLKSAA